MLVEVIILSDAAPYRFHLKVPSMKQKREEKSSLCVAIRSLGRRNNRELVSGAAYSVRIIESVDSNEKCRHLVSILTRHL